MIRELSTRLLLPAMLAMISAASQAQVIFLDGGYSEYCSTAALHADDPENTVITGSRMGLTPIEICTRAIDENDENQAASYNNRGVLYFANGDYDAAIVDFDEAISQRDDIGQFHINKGLALVRLQRWQESVESFDRGIGLGGVDEEKLAEAYYNRGVAHEETGNIPRAYYDYKAAAELRPDWELPKQELTRFSVRR